MSSSDFIKSHPCPNCPICLSKGRLIYKGLSDRLFGTVGKWNFNECDNKDCNLIWLDPMPNPDEIHKAYQEYYTHTPLQINKHWLNRLSDQAVKAYIGGFYGYSKKSINLLNKLLAICIFMHPGRKVDADFSVMWQKNRSNLKLLEIGSGSGASLKRMFDLGWTVEGVDFDPKAVKAATNLGLNVRQGSLEEQSYSNGFFDIVFMSHVIEHVHNPQSLIKNCFNVLQEGGELVLLTPNSKSLGHRLFKSSWMLLDPPRHLHVFNVKVMKELVLKAGFKEVNVKTIVRDANGAFFGSRNVSKYGQHDMSAIQSISNRTLGRLFQFFEWLLIFFDQEMGEEILIIAKK